MIGSPSTVEVVRRKLEILKSSMDERTRRHWSAAEAIELGWGGVSIVAEVTGLSRTTITVGVREVANREADRRPFDPSRIRRRGGGGGGRKPLTEIDPVTRGDRESPLR